MGDTPKTSTVEATTYGRESPAIAVGRDLHTQHSIVPERTVILFVAANPHDGDRLRGDEEAREINDRLRSGTYGERFHLQTEWAAKTATLEKALLDYEPAILHFSGHGLRGGLLLEETRSRSHKVPIAGLGRLLSQFQDTLRCVVLSCCESLSQGEVLAKYIDCVIGTPGKLADEIAVRFSASFYQALAVPKKQSIQKAFDLARASLEIQGYQLLEEQLPQLFTHRRSAASIFL